MADTNAVITRVAHPAYIRKGNQTTTRWMWHYTVDGVILDLSTTKTRLVATYPDATLIR